MNASFPGARKTRKILMPLEIYFEYSPTDPNSGGTGGDTDPYDDSYYPCGGSAGGSSTDPYFPKTK